MSTPLWRHCRFAGRSRARSEALILERSDAERCHCIEQGRQCASAQFHCRCRCNSMSGISSSSGLLISAVHPSCKWNPRNACQRSSDATASPETAIPFRKSMDTRSRPTGMCNGIGSTTAKGSAPSHRSKLTSRSVSVGRRGRNRRTGMAALAGFLVRPGQVRQGWRNMREIHACRKSNPGAHEADGSGRSCTVARASISGHGEVRRRRRTGNCRSRR